MDELTALYTAWRGVTPACVDRLPGAGSNRVYYRLTDAGGQSVIGVVGTSRDENHAFIALTRHFCTCRLPVPAVLAVSDDELRYLQTDLGSVSLFDALRDGRESGGHYSEQECRLLERTIRQLPRFQVCGAQGLDWSVCYPQPQFDEEGVLFDLNYFKYCFLKATGLDFHEVRLERDFHRFARDLVSEPSEGFLYRDFQARNVMLDADGQPCFIDYQGGRRGPYYYDLASFLWQASARYPEELRNRLVQEYYQSLAQYTDVPSMSHFTERLSLFVLFRTLQVLGAYGFRGYFERKRHFIESIPPAIDNLRSLVARSSSFPYPYMIDMLDRLTRMPGFSLDGRPACGVGPGQPADGLQTAADGCEISADNRENSNDGLENSADSPQSSNDSPAATDGCLAYGPVSTSRHDGRGPLVVRVYSFSYRKGIPADDSGNGGGYVFDCRSTHNPGRYEPYKQLTGLDEPVIRFLEDDGEILSFLESVYSLADAHVQRYIQRGFTDLMFSFGCTGGQHRSVYSAEHLAGHLHEKFGIEVRVCHREQGISRVLPARCRAGG